MASSLSHCVPPRPNFRPQLRYELNTKTTASIPNRSSWVIPGRDNPRLFLQEKVKDLVQRQEALQLERRTNGTPKLDLANLNFQGPRKQDLLKYSYDRCREMFYRTNDPFHMGGLLMDQQLQKHVWAIWAWGRILDDMVDGIGSSYVTHETLDQMEERVDQIYQGRPRDIYDIALADTVSRYPIDIQLFKDVIEGTRRDLDNSRLENYEELTHYRYFIGSAFFIILAQLIGIAPESTATTESVYIRWINIGIAMAEIDTLRDVGDDARAGRINFSKDELKLAGISDDDIFQGRLTNKWRNFMSAQANRARILMDENITAVNDLNVEARWAFWAFCLIYNQDLDVIEANDYNSFSESFTAGLARRLTILPQAYFKSIGF